MWSKLTPKQFHAYVTYQTIVSKCPNFFRQLILIKNSWFFRWFMHLFTNISFSYMALFLQGNKENNRFFSLNSSVCLYIYMFAVYIFYYCIIVLSFMLMQCTMCTYVETTLHFLIAFSNLWKQIQYIKILKN